jgi:hypothetical protein
MGLKTILNTFYFEQTTPATTWAINHNLKTITPVVDCYLNVSSVWTKVIPLEVQVVDSNNVNVVFSTAQTGRAKIV